MVGVTSRSSISMVMVNRGCLLVLDFSLVVAAQEQCVSAWPVLVARSRR